jgi:hypothetical protein
MANKLPISQQQPDARDPEELDISAHQGDPPLGA